MPDQRLRFSKTGRARYISHLDLMRTFQRAFLRAGIDIRHTEGFNRHAYVSIPLPLSVGFSSECEILEFGLVGGATQESLPGVLNQALPEGITVTRCYDAQRPAKQLEQVNYIISLEFLSGAPLGVENAFRSLLDTDSLVVDKPSKKAKTGFTQVDIIPLIHKVSYESCRDALVLDVVFRAQNPGLNPTLLLETFRKANPQFAPDFVSYHRKDVLDGNGQPFA